MDLAPLNEPFLVLTHPGEFGLTHKDAVFATVTAHPHQRESQTHALTHRDSRIPELDVIHAGRKTGMVFSEMI